MAAQSLQQLVSSAASLHSDRVAVTYDSGSVSGAPLSLRYRELEELTGELSVSLREKCSGFNGVIGLYCDDDLFVPVWILGILKSPAAYAPLDPEAPGLLSSRVIKQCGLRFCAVKADMLQRFQTSLSEHVSLEVCAEFPKFKLMLVKMETLPLSENRRGFDLPGAQTAGGAAAQLKEHGHADLAYVLHTSGTTGVPKTVRVPHRCILPNILHLRSLFQMSSGDVVLLASPLTFDPSVVDLFLALSSGAQLLIVPAVMKKMPRRLAQLLFTRHKTTVMQITPTLLIRFGQLILREEVLSACSSLRVLALGGEACPSAALLRSWRHEENKTQIYNIYGITEVSCWACVYEISTSVLQSDSLSSSSVPLGTPLMDTLVEVRDQDSCVVTDGEGQVFIGGEDRVCLLDGEDAVVPGTMRATGDWVNVRDNQMFYLGRRDRMIKRHGKRVNLDDLQQLIQTLPQVEACAVSLNEGSRLLAFVVASTPRQQTEQEQVQDSGQERLISAADRDVGKLILDQLSLLLPPHSVPDSLLLVPALNLTPHAKVDMKALLKIYKRQRQCSSSQGDFNKLKQTLQALWKKTLGLPNDASINEESNFLLSGGDSLKAVHFHEDILVAAGASSPELLEVILDGTFSDVLHHIGRVALVLPVQNKMSALPEAKKRHAGAPSAVPVKREHAERIQEARRGFIVVERAGTVTAVRNTETEMNPMEGKDFCKGDGALDVGLIWSSDTGRCVDASPVLLVENRTKTTVFIGSHSHRIQALDLTTGSLLWERILGGRIEASVAVSRCGTLVVLGCYDGCIYFLCAASGETRWTFETGDAVKSCPAVDLLTGLMMVGSHDGHVYALNPESKLCVWKHHCGGGAVFSSPLLLSSVRRLFVASLGGRLLCLNADSGEELWSISRGVPFFSSPNASSGHVLIGSVDGSICCYSKEGKLVWQFLTEGPVFSSPCFTPDQLSVLCGSHDGRLYCLNCADGSLVWTFQTTGKVYSSPFVFDGSVVGWSGPLVALASSDGAVWILDGEDGRMLSKFILPGELFSSPVVWGRSLVIGCRNDIVYCLQITVKVEALK